MPPLKTKLESERQPSVHARSIHHAMDRAFGGRERLHPEFEVVARIDRAHHPDWSRHHRNTARRASR